MKEFMNTEAETMVGQTKEETQERQRQVVKSRHTGGLNEQKRIAFMEWRRTGAEQEKG